MTLLFLECSRSHTFLCFSYELKVLCSYLMTLDLVKFVKRNCTVCLLFLMDHSLVYFDSLSLWVHCLILKSQWRPSLVYLKYYNVSHICFYFLPLCAAYTIVDNIAIFHYGSKSKSLKKCVSTWFVVISSVEIERLSWILSFLSFPGISQRWCWFNGMCSSLEEGECIHLMNSLTLYERTMINLNTTTIIIPHRN